MKIYKIFLATLFTLTLIPSVASAAFAGSEVHITKDGLAKIDGAKITQLAGGTLFARLYWGDAFVRITIKTNSKTKVYRSFGEETSLSEVKVDDFVSAEGVLEPGGSALVLIPTKIVDTSLEKAQSAFSGVVTGVNVSGQSFSMNSPAQGNLTVKISGAKVVKGSRTLSAGDIRIGDKITSVDGDFDFKANVMTAKSVVVYVNMNLFVPQNYQGTLIESPKSADLPAVLRVRVDGSEYDVRLPKDAVILRKNRDSAILTRFEAGDTIRFYGKRRELDNPVVDVEVLRNMNL